MGIESASNSIAVFGPTGMVFTAERNWAPVNPVSPLRVDQFVDFGIRAAKDGKKAVAAGTLALTLTACGTQAGEHSSQPNIKPTVRPSVSASFEPTPSIRPTLINKPTSVVPRADPSPSYELPSVEQSPSASPKPTSEATISPTAKPKPTPEESLPHYDISLVLRNDSKPIAKAKIRSDIETLYSESMSQDSVNGMLDFFDTCMFEDSFWLACAQLISQVYGKDPGHKDYISTGDKRYLSVAQDLYNLSIKMYPGRRAHITDALMANFPS